MDRSIARSDVVVYRRSIRGGCVFFTGTTLVDFYTDGNNPLDREILNLTIRAYTYVSILYRFRYIIAYYN